MPGNKMQYSKLLMFNHLNRVFRRASGKSEECFLQHAASAAVAKRLRSCGHKFLLGTVLSGPLCSFSLMFPF